MWVFGLLHVTILTASVDNMVHYVGQVI